MQQSTTPRWTWARYAHGAAYPENWIRIEETPGARLVANLPPYRAPDAIAIVTAHNATVDATGLTCRSCGEAILRAQPATDPSLVEYHAGCRPGTGRIPYRLPERFDPGDPWDAREDDAS